MASTDPGMLQTQPLFQSDRAFEIFSYTVSHGLLLLRSRRSAEFSKRVEILFYDVRAMELRCWFEGLTIQEMDKDFLANFPSNPVKLMEFGNQVYRLKSQDCQGFILGGGISFSIDEREFSEPSKFQDRIQI